MTYDHKIAIVIRESLLGWQKLNVASFLASAVAIQFPETHGRPFVNASGTQYLPFIKQPILIYQADNEGEISRALQRAQDRDVATGIYTEPLFAPKTRKKTW